MDLADIKRAAMAAREFTEVVEHVTFTLRLPTPHEAECAAARLRFSADDDETTVRMRRALVEGAVVGWSGAIVGDVLPDHPAAAESFVWHRDAVGVLLDARPQWARLLWPPLLARLEARNAQRSSAEKN